MDFAQQARHSDFLHALVVWSRSGVAEAPGLCVDFAWIGLVPGLRGLMSGICVVGAGRETP